MRIRCYLPSTVFIWVSSRWHHPQNHVHQLCVQQVTEVCGLSSSRMPPGSHRLFACSASFSFGQVFASTPANIFRVPFRDRDLLLLLLPCLSPLSVSLSPSLFHSPSFNVVISVGRHFVCCLSVTLHRQWRGESVKLKTNKQTKPCFHSSVWISIFFIVSLLLWVTQKKSWYKLTSWLPISHVIGLWYRIQISYNLRRRQKYRSNRPFLSVFVS